MKAWWAVVNALALAILALVLIKYVNLEQQKICGLVITLDNANRENPPPTERQQHIADEVSKYRRAINC